MTVQEWIDDYESKMKQALSTSGLSQTVEFAAVLCQGCGQVISRADALARGFIAEDRKFYCGCDKSPKTPTSKLPGHWTEW